MRDKVRLVMTRTEKRHGHCGNGTTDRTPTYNTWRAMRERCTNPNHIKYSNYGGRGIVICKSWKKFVSFLRDMGERPEGMTLDRIDGNKGYNPKNCKWSTLSEQNKNRRFKNGTKSRQN